MIPVDDNEHEQMVHDATKVANNNNINNSNSNNNSNSKHHHKEHMVLFVHGLYGAPTDFTNLSSQLKKKHPDINIQLSESNYFFGATRQGIDTCGDRLVSEILKLTEEHKPKKISIVGHSLGGVIGRYAIGKLEEQNYFNEVKPVQFVSLSSPHCGSRRPPNGWLNRIISKYTDTFISTTGNQLMLTDDEKDPLLVRLANKHGSYHKALSRFENRTLYSNIENDFQVVFNTSNISHRNPYTKGDFPMKFSERYNHLIDPEQMPQFEPLPVEKDPFANDEKGQQLKDILSNLQSLNFTRYHTHFPDRLAHTHIVQKREWVNQVGADVVNHIVDNIVVD
ncbi:hypothetical protein SAMD00019534_005250 [Acytostelium subglobosum LB1]|uniref:hypothetical protein n=1 Tax=Acytostelium subglobosum LB1 TaxID=1410327 RepID=UPI000644F461|nr:hypothetical protein SAMD00019534_005250 [Acytostelium subglobosum LB1]GAM17350.1 hypothetical protein SAMD00019534_005250 [Acytostelium subglobosum LB1]|eukprot:XP_012759412.1 hypothetical protein SAMD00019534_005250 [Acytostelium subglobosum LB1]